MSLKRHDEAQMRRLITEPILITEYLEEIIRLTEKVINSLYERDRAIDFLLASASEDSEENAEKSHKPVRVRVRVK